MKELKELLEYVTIMEKEEKYNTAHYWSEGASGAYHAYEDVRKRLEEIIKKENEIENVKTEIKIDVTTATETQMIWIENLFETEIEEARCAASNEHIFALGSDDEESSQHEQNAEENREYAKILENALTQLRKIWK